MNIEDIVISRKSGFQFWFKNLEVNLWNIYETASNKSVGTLAELNDDIQFALNDASDDPEYDELRKAITRDFIQFKFRPEYYVYNFINENWVASDIDKREVYKKLLVGCVFLRMERSGEENPEDRLSQITDMLYWVETSGFYDSPASTRFHGSYPGGLLDHTLTVAAKTYELSLIPTFKSKVDIPDAIFVSLVHDWCKIGRYESYMKNVKDPNTNTWEQVVAYKLKDKQLSCLGHGVSSMFLAQRFFKLSVEEALAIRWHMGEYNVANNEMDELHQANETYPLVQLIQFADRLSIVNY